jgi:hypothetical protein
MARNFDGSVSKFQVSLCCKQGETNMWWARRDDDRNKYERVRHDNPRLFTKAQHRHETVSNILILNERRHHHRAIGLSSPSNHLPECSFMPAAPVPPLFNCVL